MTEPVLVLHSAGLDKASAQFIDLPGLMAVDLQGHGERTDPSTSLQAMAADVADALVEPAHVVGLSLGGMVAQHLALDYPDKVRSLVLGCTPAHTDTAVMTDRAAQTESSSRAALVQGTLGRWFTAEALGADPEPEFIAYARIRLEMIDQRMFAATWRTIAGHDVLDSLGSLDVPTTCLAGSRDVSTPPHVVRELSEAIPGSVYVEIDAPHMAYLEQPDSFTRVLRDHLDRVARSAR